MSVIQGAGFEVQVPPGWQRIDATAKTAEGGAGVAQGDTFTVADPAGGTGAMQISTALDATNERPGLGDLRDIIQALAEKNRLGAPIEASYFELDSLRAAWSTYHHADDYIRVWSVTDGKSFALATYVCRWGSEGVEAETCDLIVRSLTFT